mmetsp:Transcript_19575/g.62901  ORF Transcript_19575/g.62901 Transcript_19575/m.62901 type:complete len:392 (-) Transcript_19575:366-1541(-)
MPLLQRPRLRQPPTASSRHPLWDGATRHDAPGRRVRRHLVRSDRSPPVSRACCLLFCRCLSLSLVLVENELITKETITSLYVSHHRLSQQTDGWTALFSFLRTTPLVFAATTNSSVFIMSVVATVRTAGKKVLWHIGGGGRSPVDGAIGRRRRQVRRRLFFSGGEGLFLLVVLAGVSLDVGDADAAGGDEEGPGEFDDAGAFPQEDGPEKEAPEDLEIVEGRGPRGREGLVAVVEEGLADEGGAGDGAHEGEVAAEGGHRRRLRPESEAPEADEGACEVEGEGERQRGHVWSGDADCQVGHGGEHRRQERQCQADRVVPGRRVVVGVFHRRRRREEFARASRDEECPRAAAQQSDGRRASGPFSEERPGEGRDEQRIGKEDGRLLADVDEV